MRETKKVEDRIRRQLGSFLVKSDYKSVEIRATTDLIKEVGLTSLQGLEFVLDLCDEFHHEFPAEFNPFVDDEARRGRTFEGLVKEVERHLVTEDASHGKK